MYVVITHPRGKRLTVHGPFGSSLAASDYSHEYSEQTGVPAEVRSLVTPEVFGDEGL